MNEIITPFTYTDLSAPVAAELQAATMRIKVRMARTVEDIIATGRDLIDKTFCDFNVIYKRLRGAILEARQLHSDKVTVYPPKPWAKS